jgi:uncharacterized protein
MNDTKTVIIAGSRSNRIDVVDALRGFAIMSIMLLHNLEHFDFYYIPTTLPQWMYPIDKAIFDVTAFLFSGKSYAIFALLFGFTFYLMDSHQAAKGNDFRLRFLWRLFLLLLFGLFNSLFYQGDILNMYALMGLALIPVCRLKDKTVLWVAIILLLQPLWWVELFFRLGNPDAVINQPHPWGYFDAANQVKMNGNLLELMRSNMVEGKIGVYLWSWEQGRFLQAPALFMLGMLMGRRQLFSQAGTKRRFWRGTLAIALACTLFFMFFLPKLSQIVQLDFVRRSLFFIFRSWYNTAFTMVWVSGFVLLYQRHAFQWVLGKLIPFGRMSLTSYVMQSFLGAFIYYGFALGLYVYTGATFSLLIGIALFLFQAWFCRWWLKTHNKGPLESLWHKGRWVAHYCRSVCYK